MTFADKHPLLGNQWCIGWDYNHGYKAPIEKVMEDIRRVIDVISQDEQFDGGTQLNESKLRNIIKESIKKVLKESANDIDDDTYYGGGLPDSYHQDPAHEQPNEYDNDEPSIPEDISNFIYEKIKDFPEKIYELDAESLSRLDNRFTYDVYWALCNENIEQSTAAKYVREYIKCYLPTYKTAYNKLRHVVEDAGWLFNETI